MKPILFSTPMVQAIIAGRKTMTRRIAKYKRADEHKEDDFPGEVQDAPDKWAPTSKHTPCSFSEGVIYAGGDEEGDKNCYVDFHTIHESDSFYMALLKCPYGRPGEILWVREAWRIVGWDWEDGEMNVEYVAGGIERVPYPRPNDEDQWMIKQMEKMVAKDYFRPDGDDDDVDERPFVRTDKPMPWRPSIHMPKEACRLFLKVTDIRVERLQDISESDAIAEGVQPNCDDASKCPSPYCEKNGCQGAGQYFHYMRDLDDFPADNAKESFESLWEKINGRESWEASEWVWVISFEKIDKPNNF